MPIYEYICGDCGTAFEELVRSMRGTPKVACPDCGSGNAERTMSAIGAAVDSSKAYECPPGGCGHCTDPRGPCAM